ncbi:U11/U12 small nuclear ribonucleoprotein 59 kDa protein isoform X2 [Selaginella moellendorffii]|uniref:U11/U12 small nuclear ribonucleoprotein 59 kDa protein isoform X2 n=1 Tax=Selaginella moellendorffii TaxID=88036 RepID=UPI000D1C9186|nr:U11/U12 small nuclear ribonucleoprotein 59 kDa protein isoform X2 [Selaginella moellendorffii]XP_024542746.1 U11/U12 small nuclear ribonucleoprotein 59 kDa protein isoform X2 [Selaginella moellendorffii]|eukprot:XP_024542745.1 U11/U12 small nuclear ribonucleoprotein 59 kDa protein isoform X2 [Selaginella moellendorffii]
MDSRLWQAPQLRLHLERLEHSLELLKAVSLELEVIAARRAEDERVPGQGEARALLFSDDPRKQCIDGILCNAVRKNSNEIDEAENLAANAARHLRREIEGLLLPLQGVVDGTAAWEQLTAVAKFRERRMKLKSNRKRRKIKRQHEAEKRRMADKLLEEADRQAEEWRTREFARDIAKKKMEEMNDVALKKAKEARLRLEKEMEMVLLVEKLQELRSLRVQKLKKQGHLFPEDDDAFMEGVRAAVEAEERQAAGAADEALPANAEARNPSTDDENTIKEAPPQPSNTKTSEEPDQRLPADLYRYYYGSRIDMGTLIEVRRGWDTYIVPVGSRIPGHWVQPVAPSSEAWASCLINRELTLKLDSPPSQIFISMPKNRDCTRMNSGP